MARDAVGRRPGTATAPIRGVSRDWAAVAIGLTLALIALTFSGATERADNLFYDLATQATARSAPDNIVVVAIDDASLAALGPWPWPRAVHAAMLRRLAADRPLAVVYDVLFVEPSPRPGEDADLGRAFAALPHAYSPMIFNTPGSNGRGYDPLWPIGPVRTGAAVGHAMVQPDRDGVVRRLDLAVDGEQRWTHVAAMAAAVRPGGGARLGLPRFVPRPPGSPLRRRGEVLVSFGGPPGHFRTASFISVLKGETPASVLRGTYVMLGATAPGSGDAFSTPAGDNALMPGIEVQANLLDTLLTGRAVAQAPIALRLALGLPALWLLMYGFLRLPPNAAEVLGVALIAGLTVLSAALLFAAHLWLPPVSTLAVLAIVPPLWTWRRLSGVSGYMIEELSRLTGDLDLADGFRARPGLGRDLIADQVDLMRDTVAQVRGLRRLVGAAVRSLPDPTVLVALDGEITLANAEASRLFSGRADVAPGDVERFFQRSPPPPFTPLSFRDPAAPWIGERAGADGSLREILHVPWTDDAGEPLGWVVRFVDVTALRRAEIAREEALQLLTHDMRSPQASILALVAREPAALSQDTRARVAHYAQRTIALADGFLRLARADAGNYEREPTDIVDALTEAVDDLWALASAREVRIAFDGGDREYMVEGNRALLIRMFTNILDNAVKFSPAGSTIDCAVGFGDVGGQGQAVCTIADHGAGMPAEVVSKLFQRFSHHSEGEGDGGPVAGVGLGLAFVQSVAKGHGGSIECRSVLGVGTTFEIVLPLLGDGASGHGAQTDENE